MNFRKRDLPPTQRIGLFNIENLAFVNFVSTRDILAYFTFQVKYEYRPTGQQKDVNLGLRMGSFERFGEKLRALRKHHNVTLHWLATQLGYTTHSYISEIESGQKSPTVVFVLKVSYLFSVTTDQLLKDELELDMNNTRINEIL